MKRKMVQKLLAVVLCAGLAVPTAMQPLTVTAFAEDTVSETESVAEADVAAEKETTDAESVQEVASDQENAEIDDAAVAEQSEAVSTEAETVSGDSNSALVGDEDASSDTTSDSEQGLIRGSLSSMNHDTEGKEYTACLTEAYIPNVQQVYFAIWSDRDGQDDIRWLKPDYEFDLENNLKSYQSVFRTYDFSPKEAGIYDGLWYVHAYAKLTDGSMEFINAATFNVNEANEFNIYRLYNPNSSEHFFTGSSKERDQLVAAGWKYEGIAWYAPEYGDNVYRLYNPNSGEHHYTMDRGERTRLVQLGWKYEGIAWLSDRYVGTPLYRLYNPNNGGSAGAHHYTASVDERNYLVSLGWRYEAIGWYGVHHEKKTGA